MNKRLGVILVALIVLGCIAAAGGEISVGVKNGDWIEYSVTTSGNPPEEHRVVWVRMEVMDVQGTAFKTNVTSEFPNGTRVSVIRSFNFSEGNVQSWIIIPANLSPGESFYDASTVRNVTIEGEEQRTYAGATRTTTFASVPSMAKRWDKATGFFVETIDDLGNYKLNATAIATNLWSPQKLEPETIGFYTIAIIVVVVIVAAISIILLTRRKK